MDNKSERLAAASAVFSITAIHAFFILIGMRAVSDTAALAFTGALLAISIIFLVCSLVTAPRRTQR